MPTPACRINHLGSATFLSSLVLALLLPCSSVSLMVVSIVFVISLHKEACFVSDFLFSLNDEHTNYVTTSRSVIAYRSKTLMMPASNTFQEKRLFS